MKGTTKLLNPGPVTLTDRVRKAFDAEDVCHREQEFADLVKRVMGKLARVYPEADGAYVPVLLTGSGTAAVEAMLGSLTPRDGKTLVVSNGVYGERAAAILEAQGKAFTMLKSASWLDGIDLAGAEAALAAGGYTHVFTVHHETTTGRLNEVGKLGALCKKHGVPMLLDAVSSFAGEDLRFADWNLEACAATANKCLHGVPGIAFALVKKDVFSSRKSAATSVYLDLFKYEKEQRTGFSPFTQATHVMVALDEALSELADVGGVPARVERYRGYTQRVLSGLAKLGVETLVPRADYSSTLTSYRLPEGVTYERLHDDLKRDGFVIYAGQGDFRGSIFRIAVMGDLAPSDIDRLLGCIERSFERARRV